MNKPDLLIINTKSYCLSELYYQWNNTTDCRLNSTSLSFTVYPVYLHQQWPCMDVIFTLSLLESCTSIYQYIAL